MKKSNKIILFIVSFVIVVTISIGFYKFFVLGQKDFGLKYTYYYCENGIYYTYSKGIVDGSISYYDRNGEFLMNCPAWGILEGRCKEIYGYSGKCVKK